MALATGGAASAWAGRVNAQLAFELPPRNDADAAFRVWADVNAHIVDAFCRRAMDLRVSGREHYGAKRIVEELRYDTALTERSGAWKINNSFVSRLARLAMERCHELRGFFEVRALQE